MIEQIVMPHELIFSECPEEGGEVRSFHFEREAVHGSFGHQYYVFIYKCRVCGAEINIRGEDV